MLFSAKLCAAPDDEVLLKKTIKQTKKNWLEKSHTMNFR